MSTPGPTRQGIHGQHLETVRVEKIVALLIIVGFIFSIYQAIMSGRLEIWLAALAIAMVFLKGVSYLEERRNKTE